MIVQQRSQEQLSTCLEAIIFSRTEDPMLVAAPTELVAMPAMMRGAARPPVVRVRMPPAIVRLPPTTLAPVPTVRVILHLKKGRE